MSEQPQLPVHFRQSPEFATLDIHEDSLKAIVQDVHRRVLEPNTWSSYRVNELVVEFDLGHTPVVLWLSKETDYWDYAFKTADEHFNQPPSPEPIHASHAEPGISSQPNLNPFQRLGQIAGPNGIKMSQRRFPERGTYDAVDNFTHEKLPIPELCGIHGFESFRKAVLNFIQRHPERARGR
jgi:hypothetical protein